jgi:hypothetical protein
MTEIEQVSDADVFNEAVAPEPKTEVAPSKEEAAEVEAKTPRDEKGRFKAKAEDDGGDETPPAAEAALEVPPVEATKEEKPDHIPSWRLKEEAEAKRDALRRAETAEREREAIRQQYYQMQQQLQAMQQPKEPIDIFAQPEQYQQHIEQSVAERLRAMEGNFSLRLASYKHGDTFQQAWGEMLARSQSGDDSLRQQVLQSPDPGETLVQLYQRESVLKEVGTDPVAYKSKVLEDALKDPQFLAKALQAAKVTAGAQPTHKIDLPPSLNKVAAAHGGDTDDASDRGVYSFATR